VSLLLLFIVQLFALWKIDQHSDFISPLSSFCKFIYITEDLVVCLFITEEICGYTIYKTLSDLPFRIVEVDRISGSARIVLAPGSVLDYEQVHQYNFEIAAHDCETGNHAQRLATFTFTFLFLWSPLSLEYLANLRNSGVVLLMQHLL